MANSDDQRDDKAQDEQQPSNVRRRVTRHLRNLLIPGVMGLGACKSADTPVVCDPMPAPADGGAGAPPSSGDSEATPDATAPEPTQPPPVVCDPMPAPVPPPPPPDKKK